MSPAEIGVTNIIPILARFTERVNLTNKEAIMRKSVKIIIGTTTGGIALITGIGIAGGSHTTTTIPSPSISHSASASPYPAITTSQQQALDSAKGYLSDGEGFSRQGLINQLTSPVEKFTVADATWAVDHSGADWNAQAVMSAKGYMSDGEGFSRQGLIDQLTSQAGQFTLAQATYAANQVNL